MSDSSTASGNEPPRFIRLTEGKQPLMAERTQKSKGTTSREADASVEAAPATTETGEKLTHFACRV